jgi:hypothetical protein
VTEMDREHIPETGVDRFLLHAAGQTACSGICIAHIITSQDQKVFGITSHLLFEYYITSMLKKSVF